MKKRIFVFLVALAILATLIGCGNKQIFDTTLRFDQAIVSLPDGQVVSAKVQSWTDYEDGDQIQVKNRRNDILSSQFKRRPDFRLTLLFLRSEDA